MKGKMYKYHYTCTFSKMQPHKTPGGKGVFQDFPHFFWRKKSELRISKFETSTKIEY